MAAARKLRADAVADKLRLRGDVDRPRLRAAADKVAVLVAIVTSEIGSEPRNGPRSDQRFGSPMCT